MYKQYFDETYSAKAPENYEQFFVPAIGRPLAEDLVEQADIQAGENVLDVACGTGIVARLASPKVGAGGSVSGLDPNPEMLTVARSLDDSMEWYEASAEAIPLPDDYFDVVFCQMGLQFMEEKAVAMQEMWRVLTPGGRLLLNVPGPVAELFAIMVEGMKKHIGEQAAGFVMHVFSLDSSEEIQQLMRKAGFNDINVYGHSKKLHLPKPGDFLWQYIYSTPLAAVVLEADEASRTALETEVVHQWQAFAKGDSMSYTQHMLSAVARK